MSVAAIDSSENIWLSLINQQLKKTSATDTAVASAATETVDQTQATSEVDFSQMISAKLDTNGDGTISEEELQAGVQDARELFASLNSQNSKMRAFEAQSSETTETTATETAPPPPPPPAEQVSFSNIDTNNDGTISEEEFAVGMEAMKAQQLAQEKIAGASKEEESGLSSYFSSEKFSIPGLMGGMGDLMTFMGQGQGNMPAYNMLMDQLLQRG